ncbi:MAG: hypothetical protein IJM88_05150, partial [Bacteroidales bacterium]|nr:hypothetical protein [Bacteroidales bacterium]
PFGDAVVAQVRQAVQRQFGVSADEAGLLVTTGQLVNHAYSFDDSEIKVLFKDGRCIGISEASDQLDRPFLEKTVTKFHLSYPKNLQIKI